MAAFGVVATTTTPASITFLTPAPAHAYVRRDVGGDDGSAEQAAYNLQAFETNSRLEREDPRGTKSIVDGGSLTVLAVSYTHLTLPTKRIV